MPPRTPDSVNLTWLKEHIPRSPWTKNCPHGGTHHISFYQASGDRDLDRFGDQSFYLQCTANKCFKAVVSLSPARRRELYPEFLQFKRQNRAARAANRAPRKPVKRKKKNSDDNSPSGFIAILLLGSRSDALNSEPSPARKKQKKKSNTDAAADPVAPTAAVPTHSEPSASSAKGKDKARAVPEAACASSTPTKGGNTGHASVVHNPVSATAQVLPVNLQDLEIKDGYDTDTYEIEDDERRRVEFIIFTDGDKAPIRQTVTLRAVSHLNFFELPLAAAVNAPSNPRFSWFCPLTQEWNMLRNEPINFHPRGSVFIIRDIALREARCPDLAERMAEAFRSVLDIDPEDDEVIEIIDTDSDEEFPRSIALPRAQQQSAVIDLSSD
ncbi:hypothetical protein R3P38DRAFT_2780598 [Favolaschia claudopus]|uniref:Uncharacterized protein n=1 Tax=Favolaschia claudopus TaxID=2862362 RepID=A0AAW0BCM2_9AGAR